MRARVGHPAESAPRDTSGYNQKLALTHKITKPGLHLTRVDPVYRSLLRLQALGFRPLALGSIECAQLDAETKCEMHRCSGRKAAAHDSLAREVEKQVPSGSGTAVEPTAASARPAVYPDFPEDSPWAVPCPRKLP